MASLLPRALLCCWLSVLTLGFASAADQDQATAARPNILFCFADDWGRVASAYANVHGRPSLSDVVKTPNIDRVANGGVLFRNAFVTSPSCTPCRSSLLSGQYFFRTGRGAILQGAQWDPSIPSFPLILKDAGYHIGETYKVWSPGTPNDAPFGSGKYEYERAGGAFNNFSENATKMVRTGQSFVDAKDQLLADVSNNFDDFLRDRPDGKPFCYWFGPTNVHRKWEKGSGKSLWGIESELLKGKLPRFLPDVPEVREDFADYLGEIQAFDSAVGLLLKKLENLGELNRTLVVVSGDHGPPGFPGGKCNLYDFGVGVSLVVMGPGIKGKRIVDDFVNLMDLAPTFVDAAGEKPPSVMTGRSLLPVLKSEKGGLVDSSRSWVITGRERHVAAAREDNLPYPQRALRTASFLYIRNFRQDRWPLGRPTGITEDSAPTAADLEDNTFAAFSDMDASPTKAWLVEHRNDAQWRWHYDYAFAKRPEEELFDLRKDPDQTSNVASDPAYADVRRELSEQLIKQLTQAEDPRVTGDGNTFERPPFTDPDRPAAKAEGRKKKAKR